MKRAISVCLAAAMITGAAMSGCSFDNKASGGASGADGESVFELKNDKDKDGVSDIVEELMGCDPEKEDTDGDGLNDYQEIFLTGTDPVKADTDGNGKKDPQSDSDTDGIDNITEIRNETDPVKKDTDGDGLSDKEEEAYKTDPKKYDTDGDGAADGWEVTHNYDSLKKQGKFQVTETASEGGLSVTVKVQITGEETERLILTPSRNLLLDSSVPGYMGAAFEVSADDEDIKNVDISFKSDKKLDEDKNRAPVIYSFDKDTQLLTELKTTVKGDTASATAEKGSAFILLDKKEYDKVWSARIEKEPENAPDKNKDKLSDNYTKLICDGTLRMGTGRENPFRVSGYTLEKLQAEADADGDGLMNGDEIEVVQKGSGAYIKMKSDPCSGDSDYDGIDDKKDDAPLDNHFDVSYSSYYDSIMSYTMDFRDFFRPNDEYSRSLCSSSILLALSVAKQTVSCNGSNVLSDVTQFLEFHGFSDVIDYSYTEGCDKEGIDIAPISDDDVTEIGIGHRTVTYNGETKTIIALSFRGTEGVTEWSSNFDIGDPDEWKEDDLRGFTKTKERAKVFVEKYIKKYLSDKKDIVYWVTGHSRGGGMTNVMGADLVRNGKTVYAYGLAGPCPTTAKDINDPKYNCIFNICNNVDMVTMLPMVRWGFGRYGVTRCYDMDDPKAMEIWKDNTTYSNYNNTFSRSVFRMSTDKLSEQVKTREDLYKKGKPVEMSKEEADMIPERAKKFCEIKETSSGSYEVRPSLMFVCQLMANVLGKSETKESLMTFLKLWGTEYSPVIAFFLEGGLKKADSFEGMKLTEAICNDAHYPYSCYIITSYCKPTESINS